MAELTLWRFRLMAKHSIDRDSAFVLVCQV
jgi:hypothetical protein